MSAEVLHSAEYFSDNGGANHRLTDYTTDARLMPNGWQMKRLGQLVEFLDGQRRPVKSADRAKMSGIYPYYGASGIVDYVNDYLFDEDLILLGEDGENILSRNTRLAFRVSGKVWVNNHAHVLRPNGSVEIAYLAEYLESLNYEQYNSGTAQPKLNKQTCQQIPVAVPPLHEQRTIAAALSDVDGLLAELEALIVKKRDIRQATMQQLLCGRTRLPGFHGKWDTPTLGSLFVFKNGLNKAKEFFGHGTPIVNYMDVYEHRGIRQSDLVGRVSLSKEELKNFEVRKGDVFFTRTSETAEEVGITSVMLDSPESTVFSGFVLRARPKDDSLDDKFKQFCFLTSSVRQQIVSQSTETTRALTNGGSLSLVKIARPPKSEQRAIAEVLTDMDAELEALRRRQAKTLAIKQGMMQQLLTGRIRLVKPEQAEVNA